MTLNHFPLYSMNIHHIIGQLFILGFQGRCAATTRDIQQSIAEDNLGGVILFDRCVATKQHLHNIESLEQLRQLTTILQQSAKTKIFIAIDQEGGSVRRLKPQHGFFDQPSAQTLGNTSIAASHDIAKKTASALRALGINLNFAPVADLAINRDNPIVAKLGRSFAADPAIVTDHCRAWLTEFRLAGICGCLKHFPGHGSSTNDSHLHFVDTTDVWQQQELFPYETLIAENQVDMVMVGHLYNHNLDPNYPASLSQPTLLELLRIKLGFQGCIVTDDMQMQAIVSRYGLADACILALKAGVDMIIIGNNLHYDGDILKLVGKRIMQAIAHKEISEQRIVEAYENIRRIKEALP